MTETIRFSKIVEVAGKPIVHVLWIDPAKDTVLQKAIKANRVMTIHQRPGGTKTDYGTIGFEKNVSGQVLIFPKSLKPFADKRVVGVKYDLLEWPPVPKSKQAPKPWPAKRPTRSKPQDPEIPVVTGKQPAVEESGPARVVKFPTPKANDALVESGKIAIALVVIRARQHLAAVKPQKRLLMLELMYFPERLIDASEFKAPAEKPVGKAEMQMAKQLIQSMTSEWKPEQYTDQYHEALEKKIEEKIEHGGEKRSVPLKKKKPTNVVDLISVLQQSIQQTQAKPKSDSSAKKTRGPRRKKAA
jgi:hypothetical protein